MSEVTLESLAERVAALEKDLAERKAKSARKKDWRRTGGKFTGNEFMKQIDAEGQAIREADRQAAREEHAE